MNLIQSTILTSLPAGRKKTPSGWISFNAPCCIHNGESQDKKKRGGIMTSADGTVSYILPTSELYYYNFTGVYHNIRITWDKDDADTNGKIDKILYRQ